MEKGKGGKGDKRPTGGNVASAKEVGKLIAERAKQKGIKKVVFDRGGYLYHGRIKALADAAREAGWSSRQRLAVRRVASVMQAVSAQDGEMQARFQENRRVNANQ